MKRIAELKKYVQVVGVAALLFFVGTAEGQSLTGRFKGTLVLSPVAQENGYNINAYSLSVDRTGPLDIQVSKNRQGRYSMLSKSSGVRYSVIKRSSSSLQVPLQASVFYNDTGEQCFKTSSIYLKARKTKTEVTLQVSVQCEFGDYGAVYYTGNWRTN